MGWAAGGNPQHPWLESTGQNFRVFHISKPNPGDPKSCRENATPPMKVSTAAVGAFGRKATPSSFVFFVVLEC
jgi:hypothetical protein